MDYYGYFDTNATEGFNDYSIADGHLKISIIRGKIINSYSEYEEETVLYW
jgi:hypothetical protein